MILILSMCVIIRRVSSDYFSKLVQHWVINCLWFKEVEGGVKGVSKSQTLKQPEEAELDIVLCKWFTAVCSQEKPVTGLNDN